MLTSPPLFNYFNFMLQFCPTNPSEKDLMRHFARLNIGAGKIVDFASLSPESQKPSPTESRARARTLTP